MEVKTYSGELSWKSSSQLSNNQDLHSKFMEILPQLGPNWHMHMPIGLRVQALARINYYTDLYKKIVDVPGVICEFGVQWGGHTCNANQFTIHSGAFQSFENGCGI